MGMNPAELYARLKANVKEMPPLEGFLPLSLEAHQWLGRAHALVKEANVGFDAISFATTSQGLIGALRDTRAQEIKAILYRALAHAELAAPVPRDGAFIAARSPVQVFAELAKILTAAATDVFIVDPYVDAIALTDVAVLVPSRVPVRLLGDREHLQPNLAPGVARWQTEHADRPLQARIGARRTIHDRLIVVDNKEVWNLSQSIKNFSDRAPGSIERSTAEIGEMKIHAYSAMWTTATPIDRI